MVLIELLDLFDLFLLKRFLLFLLFVVTLFFFSENCLEFVLELFDLSLIGLGVGTIHSNLLLIIEVSHLVLEVGLDLLDLLFGD